MWILLHSGMLECGISHTSMYTDLHYYHLLCCILMLMGVGSLSLFCCLFCLDLFQHHWLKWHKIDCNRGEHTIIHSCWPAIKTAYWIGFFFFYLPCFLHIHDSQAIVTKRNVMQWTNSLVQYCQGLICNKSVLTWRFWKLLSSFQLWFPVVYNIFPIYSTIDWRYKYGKLEDVIPSC